MKTPFRESYFYTTHADLAAVLSALGFKMRRVEPITRVVAGDGRQTTTFFFEDTSENPDFGTLHGKEIVDCFRGDVPERIKEECPALASHIDYMATAFKNRALMIEAIKTNVKAIGAHQIGEKTMFLPLDASPELEAKMKRMIAEVG